jgi:hypothetical protein
MNFAKINSDGSLGQVISEYEFRALYPSTLFPADINEEHVIGFDDWKPVVADTTIPGYDPKIQKLQYVTNVENGVPTSHVVAINMTDDEKEESINTQINSIKYNRNNMIKETDYLVLSDYFSKFSTEDQKNIIDYRQALRDLPDNISDPFNVKYPSLKVQGVKLNYIVSG